MTEEPVARVLLAVQQVPAGRVATYGDIGAVTGVGARRVGAILAQHGSTVPWWRVVGHDGVLAPLKEARGYWAAEGIRVRADGRGCTIAAYRADFFQMAADYVVAARDLGWDLPQPR